MRLVQASTKIVETVQLVWAYDGERRRIHTDESAEDGYTRDRAERTIKIKMERYKIKRLEKYWTESR